jgi:hypothetical protein
LNRPRTMVLPLLLVHPVAEDWWKVVPRLLLLSGALCCAFWQMGTDMSVEAVVCRFLRGLARRVSNWLPPHSRTQYRGCYTDGHERTSPTAEGLCLLSYQTVTGGAAAVRSYKYTNCIECRHRSLRAPSSKLRGVSISEHKSRSLQSDSDGGKVINTSTSSGHIGTQYISLTGIPSHRRRVVLSCIQVTPHNT